MASEKQIAANRQNAKKSPGPGNTESTRFNAIKHGLLAAGVTELDDAEGYQRILADLMREKNPVGVIETHRVRCMALDVVRQTRAQRLEAEFITSQLNPATLERESDPLLALQRRELDPGIPATLRLDATQYLVTVYQRYEGFFSNDLSRNERELERSQRMRHGERLPAPAAIEITVRADTETAGPGECLATSNLQETLPSPLPEAIRADEAPNEAGPAASPSSSSDSVDRERSSAPEPLWQKARPKPIWSR
ncbi:MAG: hypothetical protein DMG80_02540 [Acidobacteria bacterium]|nr:MAG: hypothetical protein DMG80_02540 [Acidobacteriota bacterium]